MLYYNKLKETMQDKLKYIKGLLRLAMGWIFLWSFLDKVFGLGFATPTDKSWLAGTSPTLGMLKFGTSGPFKEVFQAIAGLQIIDWLFMLGLLLVGIALILGIANKLATTGGIIILLLIYLSILPPEHNPLIDEHIIYILILLLLYANGATYSLGFGKRWEEIKIVKKYPNLK